MQPLVTLVTLGVDDLNKSLRFYRDGLGFPTEGIVGEQFEYGAVAFVQLQPGLRLAIWPRKSIAHDTGLPVGPHSATEFTLPPLGSGVQPAMGSGADVAVCTNLPPAFRV